VTDEIGVEKYVAAVEPGVVIHAAAITSIRSCESDRTAAWKTNVGGTSNLIRACERRARKPYFVYISTACVFQGDKGNYVETDVPYPKNFYAVTKLVGEQLTLNSHLARKLVARTNFVGRGKWAYARAFSDRYGTYLFADDVARALKSIVLARLSGVVHIAGKKRMSIYDVAKLNNPEIKSMTMKDYRGPPLTIDMTLRSDRLMPYKISI